MLHVRDVAPTRPDKHVVMVSSQIHEKKRRRFTLACYNSVTTEADWVAWLPGTCQVSRLVQRPGGPAKVGQTSYPVNRESGWIEGRFGSEGQSQRGQGMREWNGGEGLGTLS